MVGLVIVSHSRSLADALVNLVIQVTNAEIPIAIAAGVGPERDEFGTDAVEIMEAIQSVYSEDGVLVLMDLGSAILSAEMALELLPPELVENVRFCAAPVVEGAIAAGVQIGLGSDLDTVCNEASTALVPKIEHITGAEEQLPAGVLVSEDIQPETEQVVLTLKNLHGLHARPAARFVQVAAVYDANIQVTNLTTGKGPVSAKSLNAIATLGAVRDHQIAVLASGTEASLVLGAIRELVESNFGETLKAEKEIPQIQRPKVVSDVEGAIQAIPISDGFALGPLYRYRQVVPPIPQELAENPDEEWRCLEKALDATETSIHQRRKELALSLGESEAAIFDAHMLILKDPDMLSSVHSKIFEDQKNAAAAWDESIKAIAESYSSLDDPYLQQRAADVLDVGNQVLFALAEKPAASEIKFGKPVILFAHELTPTETSQLDMSQVLGLITVMGGPTSHSAILSRALGIPAISGANATFEKLGDGTLLALDGFAGNVWVDPPEKVRAEIDGQRKEWIAQREHLLQSSHELATTRDGHRVEVVANVGNVMDAQAAVRNGAEGIGLLRTEFLYLTRDTPPTEAEQVDTLLLIGEALSADEGDEKPIIVRTLDVGGDKDLPYLDLPVEANPFLGVRAIRLSLRNPEVFVSQLRAVLRAGHEYQFKIMFPMVANHDEVIKARELLEKAHLSLQEESTPHLWPIETGIMVEVPAAALLSPELAPYVDFFSIGTNDLTQYTLAAERGNPELSEFADALHPAVLRLIQYVAEAAHKQGKWVGVCGELAGDPVAVPILVGLGVDELSMTPGSIPKVKAILRSIDLAEAKDLASQVLNITNPGEVRNLANQFLEKHLQE
jgi:phosphoenolpyruvate-protein phosphotransferase/dihydroxyacetone kinase phosphotransfer subunit